MHKKCFNARIDDYTMYPFSFSNFILIFSYIYPTMDELASQMSYVLTHFGIKQFIGFGVGAGANILARYSLSYPERVSALCLINCVSTQAGWIEWGYQKLNARHLRSKGMTQGVLEYLMWHHFGRVRNIIFFFFQHSFIQWWILACSSSFHAATFSTPSKYLFLGLPTFSFVPRAFQKVTVRIHIFPFYFSSPTSFMKYYDPFSYLR